MDKKKLAPKPVAVNSDSQIVVTDKPEAEVSSASSQAEIISASPAKMPADMTNDELVERVSGFFNKVLDELPYIIEIRHRFALLKRNNANIAGCRSWKQFCETRLHRTDRRIRQVLAAKAAVDEGKAKPVDATKKKREPGITPPAAASNWDAAETSRKCLAYVVNCLEHLGGIEVDHALNDLIAKLQDERRMRQDPGPKKSGVKHRDTGKRARA